MSLQRLVINTGASGSVDDFKSECDLVPLALPGLQNFENWLSGVSAGLRSGLFSFNVGAVQAVGSITQTSTGAANDETLTVAGVTFTAKTSGATGNQWNRSDTVATSATNLAASINASADTNIYVSASASEGVVTVTVLQPGVLGNLVTITESCANTTCVTPAGGTEGTLYTLDLR